MAHKDVEEFLALVKQKHALSDETIRKMTPQEIMVLAGAEGFKFTVQELQEYLELKPDQAVRLSDSELTAVGGGGVFDPELEIDRTVYYVFCRDCNRVLAEHRDRYYMEQLKIEHQNAFPGHWAWVSHREQGTGTV